MSDEETSGSGGKAAKKDKKGKPKSNLVPAIIIAVGMLLGGKMMAGGKSAPVAAAAGATEPVDCATQDTLKPPTEGAVFKLDSIPINLADGHYAKVGLALQLSSDVNLEVFKEESEAYKASDVLISIVGGRDRAEFGSPQALEALKESITDAVRPKFDCKVLDVLLTEFVIQ